MSEPTLKVVSGCHYLETSTGWVRLYTTTAFLCLHQQRYDVRRVTRRAASADAMYSAGQHAQTRENSSGQAKRPVTQRETAQLKLQHVGAHHIAQNATTQAHTHTHFDAEAHIRRAQQLVTQHKVAHFRVCVLSMGGGGGSD